MNNFNYGSGVDALQLSSLVLIIAYLDPLRMATFTATPVQRAKDSLIEEYTLKYIRMHKEIIACWSVFGRCWACFEAF